MKDPIVRTRTYTVLTSSLVVMVLFAALLSAAPLLAALPPGLDSFAVLGGPAVTLTGSTVNGNVGSLGAFTNTGSTVNGTVYQGVDAQPAYNDFLGEYTALGNVPCGQTIDGNLAGQFFTPGVYCVATSSTTTNGVLTLVGSSTDTWIFKIGTSDPTAYLVGTGFTVVGVTTSGERWSTCNNNVFWWVADYATLTNSVFMGSILAGAAITVTGGTFNGNALAKAAVTLTDTTIGCTPWSLPVKPTNLQLGSIKVTGGGQISVPNGQATFGFNAQPDKKGGAKGNLNYVNHVTGLHINGTVDNIMVIDINPDNSPKTVLFSGTYEGGSFIVTVQDKGEPGTTDEFGIWVTGSLSETTPMRVISNGNIQFHK
jgi:Ice-binding-like